MGAGKGGNLVGGRGHSSFSHGKTFSQSIQLV